MVVSEDSGGAAEGVFACQTTNWFWLFQRTVGGAAQGVFACQITNWFWLFQRTVGELQKKWNNLYTTMKQEYSKIMRVKKGELGELLVL